jgi:MFS family permease
MRYFVLALLGLVAVIAYVQRLAISVPTKEIQRDLALTATTMGLVMGCWNWGYALFQLPAGSLADRWGSKPAILLFAVVWSALTACVGLVRDSTELLAVWSLMGMAQAGVFPCATKAIGAWFPAGERATASGVLVSCQALGIGLAPLVTAMLLEHLSWRQTFAVYLVPGLAWAIAYALVPARSDAVAVSDRRPVDWSRLVRDPSMMLLCTQQFLRAAAMVFFMTWFPRFLQETGEMSPTEAGKLAAFPGFGAMLGGLLGGAASDWLLRRTGNRRLSRQGVAVFGMVLCAGLVLAAYFVRNPVAVVALFSVGAFWGTFGGVNGYSVAIDFGGSRIGVVFGTMNACGSVGAGLFPLAIGWAVDQYQNWNVAILGFAALFAGDAVCWATLNPKRPLFEDDDDPD